MQKTWKKDEDAPSSRRMPMNTESELKCTVDQSIFMCCSGPVKVLTETELRKTHILLLTDASSNQTRPDSRSADNLCQRLLL